MRKFFLVLLSIMTITFICEPCFAKKRGKKSKKKDRHAVLEVKYSGFAAKRDPFGLPKEMVRLLEKPETLKGVDILKQQVDAPSVDIQGIIWSKRRPQVIIDGSVMKVGDYVENFEIKEITRNSVILFFKGKTFPISVKSSGGGSKRKRKK